MFSFMFYVVFEVPMIALLNILYQKILEKLNKWFSAIRLDLLSLKFFWQQHIYLSAHNIFAESKN